MREFLLHGKKMEFILSGLSLMCLNIISLLIWPENENTASCSSERLSQEIIISLRVFQRVLIS